MKRKQRTILDYEENIIWDKLKATFEEYGALNTFKAMLTGIRDTKYNDLTISEILDTLFSRDRATLCLKYLDDTHMDTITWEVQQNGNYELFKVENMAQQIRFDNFLEEIENNPCQLKLIA